MLDDHIGELARVFQNQHVRSVDSDKAAGWDSKVDLLDFRKRHRLITNSGNQRRRRTYCLEFVNDIVASERAPRGSYRGVIIRGLA